MSVCVKPVATLYALCLLFIQINNTRLHMQMPFNIKTPFSKHFKQLVYLEKYITNNT